MDWRIEMLAIWNPLQFNFLENIAKQHQPSLSIETAHGVTSQSSMNAVHQSGQLVQIC